MASDGLFSSTVNLLSKTLDLRTRNHIQISANLANAETPGYTPTALSFEKELQGVVKKGQNPVQVQTVSHPRHIPLRGNAANLEQVRGTVIEVPAANPGFDQNGVELENEMARMTQNQIMFNAAVQILGKKFDSLKSAIKGAP